MLIARLALAALSVPVALSTLSAAEAEWKSISTSDFSAWREADHPGWSVVADAALRAGANSRLDGEPGTGVLLSRGQSNLYTVDEFQDLDLKLEFMVPAGSNSGVKFNGHYEIQILDSHERAEADLTGSDCGGVYPRADARYQHIDKGSPPSENAALPPGEWQTLEIQFIAPRFDAAGKKIASARFVEVKLNGKTVQKDVEVKYPTGHAWDDVPEVARGPLMLQGDHGPVAFRNIQIRTAALGSAADAEPDAEADDSTAAAAVPPGASSRTRRPQFGFGPRPLPAGVKAERNIAYVEGGHPNQVLDLFLPEEPASAPLPLIIWIHGGAWLGGSHESPSVLHLLDQGFAIASIQYRFSSHAIWPAQAHDCKAAVRFLRASAAKYNIDPERFAVGGESAGGHLAALLGTSGDVPELEGDLGYPGVSTRVQAVVDLFGPTDLTVMGEQAGPGSMIKHEAANSPESLLMGGPILERRELARTANPLTYIDRSDPPFLVIHGDKDPLVPLAQSEILAKSLNDAGLEVTMKSLPGAGHGGPQFSSTEIRQQIEDFLVLHVKAAK